MRSAHRGRKTASSLLNPVVAVSVETSRGLASEDPKLSARWEAGALGDGRRGEGAHANAASPRAGLLPSRRRRGCRFAAVTGHQRLDRPTLGRGDGPSRRRAVAREEGRRFVGAAHWLRRRDRPGHHEGHRAAKFDSVSRRAGLRIRSLPFVPRIPRAHPNLRTSPPRKCGKPGGERRPREATPTRRPSTELHGHGGVAAAGWSEAARIVCDAPAVIRGGAAGAGRPRWFRPRHRSLGRFQHHIPELQVRARAGASIPHADQGDWPGATLAAARSHRRRSPHRPGRPPGSTPTASSRRRRRRSR